MYDTGINNFQFDSNVTGNNNVVDNDMNVDINMMNGGQSEQTMMSSSFNASSGPVQERCVHKTIVHEVPQE